MKYIFRKKINILLAGIFDAVGYLVFGLFRPKRPPLPGDFKTILVIRMDHLGDVLLATPIPKLIKEGYPASKLIFLTSSWSRALLENNPFIDEVLIYDAPWFSKGRYKKSPESVSFWRLVRLLRAMNVDLGIGFRGDLRENLLLRLADVRERIGYGITGGGFFLTRKAHYRNRVHESQHSADLLKAIGLRPAAWAPELYFSAEETRDFERKLAGFDIRPGERYVGFQPAAGVQSKNWPRHHIAALLREFGRRFPAHRLVLVGSPQKKINELVASSGVECVNLLGRTSLRELCLLMGKFDLFVGPDSGPTHIASALGVPTVFLYSGTNFFEQWKPLGDSAVTLNHPVSCAPCGLEVCRVKGHPCLSQITPETVLRAMETQLK